jgi:hypothetical protein
MDVEALLILLGALLGEALGWATQQGGSIIHDIFPIKECENEQLGTGSLQTLWWHNEDAFHDYRADYIGMACLRNPDNVATTIASIDDVRISQKTSIYYSSQTLLSDRIIRTRKKICRI